MLCINDWSKVTRNCMANSQGEGDPWIILDLVTIKNTKYIPAIQMPFKVTVTGKRLDSFTECITTQGCECINGNDRASIDKYFLVISQLHSQCKTVLWCKPKAAKRNCGAAMASGHLLFKQQDHHCSRFQYFVYSSSIKILIESSLTS